MKFRSFLFPLISALMAGGSSIVLTGCVDDDYWPYSPVGPYDTNYMDFYGDGHGRYYYYRNSHPYSEEMAYFCQRSGSTTTNYQINIQYEDGTGSTMAYWFTDGGNTLWLQWQTGNGRVMTYLYDRVSYIPW